MPGMLRDLDRLQITVVTDNYYDALRADHPIGKRCRILPGASIHAEHGVSFYVEAQGEGDMQAMMFDFGLDALGVLGNMELLGIQGQHFDALSLSHGHFDHWGGLTDITSYCRRGTRLYVGKEAFAHRFYLRPSTDEPLDLGQLNRETLEEAGIVKIVEVQEAEEIIPGVYLTGYIERREDYETNGANLLVKRGEGLEQDDFPGEQALVCSVKDRGLVVVSGCAHAGIINTVKRAQRMTGIEKVHAVLGGFHLINKPPEIIEKTIHDMKSISPDYVIPAHCTGFEAIRAFAEEMPDQLILNTAGTRYVFGI